MISITILSVTGLVLLFVGFLNRIAFSKFIAVGGLGLALAALFMGNQHAALPGIADIQLSFDGFAIKFSALILVFSIFIVFLSGHFLKKEFVQSAEFLAVTLFSLVGAIMLTSFTHMITLFVGLETLGISLYILAGTDKKSNASNEASLKYLLMGAFATGLILFGMAMVYGATGLLDFRAIAQIGGSQMDSGLFQIGIFFLLIGLLFKISAAPFHFWSPDVYEGSPNVVMAFMAVVVKIASFAALFRVFGHYFSGLTPLWWNIVYYACLTSLVAGNFLALIQKSIKRQLAFSSISQTGYLLFAILALKSTVALDALVFYLFVYGCAVLVVFAVLSDWFGSRSDIALNDLKGASKKDDFGSFALSLAYLSMAGIPLTGGFIAKLFMFSPAMEAGLIQLLITGILTSVVGAAYYFRPIINVWFSTGLPELEKEKTYQWIAFLGGTMLLVSGLFPDTLTRLIALI
jgi:NADH-quinone oxidoreductase subunit N